MTDLRTAAQMALDIMLSAIKAGDWKVDGACDPDYVIEALRAALAKGEQEPHGYLWFTRHMEQRFTHRIPKEDERIGDVKPVYTAPPQREWQGLTDEELCDVCEALGVTVAGPASEAINALFRAIEAKLKEKNK